MMSSNRKDYGSAAEWLSALRLDEAWQSQLQQLQSASAGDLSVHREDALRRIGNAFTFEFWCIYCHQVDKVVAEVWEIAELSLPKLKIQTIGMLAMEWIEQQTGEGKPSAEGAKKRTAKKKPEKPRETMTFIHKGCVLEGHLTILFNKLTQDDWIDGNEADFKALFSGKADEDCQLTWKGKYGKGTLAELFKQLVSSTLVIIPDGFTQSAILEGHFKDTDGHWLTGLDKGNAANDKALPIINECVKLLKAKPEQLIYGDDDDEDFKSEYDPYDHQDLNIHKC